MEKMITNETFADRKATKSMMEENRAKYLRFKKRRIRKKIKYFINLLTIVLCTMLIITIWKDSGIKKYISERFDRKSEATKVISDVDKNISKPVERKEAEVIECLAQMAGGDERFKEIYQNIESYPKEMLASLVNNPEMVDFVMNYNKDRKQTKAELTREEKEEAYPLFLQWDQRWGYEEYGGSIIGMNGCGPTCLSMVIFALTRDSDITPDVIAAFSEEEGHYVKGTGTSWSLMTEGAKKYGLKAREVSLDKHIMERELDAGHPIICALRAGDFTTLGHFIVIYDYDENGFMVNDPNCIARSKRQWEYEDLCGQIKNMWSYEY